MIVLTVEININMDEYYNNNYSLNIIYKLYDNYNNIDNHIILNMVNNIIV